jgi:hypothetical protein
MALSMPAMKPAIVPPIMPLAMTPAIMPPTKAPKRWPTPGKIMPRIIVTTKPKIAPKAMLAISSPIIRDGKGKKENKCSFLARS